MNIISITIDANSSACAMRDGEVVAAVSEERFNKIKNYIGYPKKSVEYCLDQLGGTVDKVLLPSPQLDPQSVVVHWTRRNVEERMREQNEYWYPKIYGDAKNTIDYMKVFPEYVDFEQYPHAKEWEKIDFSAPLEVRVKQFQKLRKSMVAKHIQVSEDIIDFKDHHLCHANYAYYGSPIRNEPVLCFTADGFGDYYCATLRKYDENGNCEILMQTSDALLGRLYRFVTLVLKMKPLEDEYKVMGLAPYASEYHWKKPYEIFKQFLEVDGLGFKVKEMPADFFFTFKKKLESCRFDAIAGGLQEYLEEMIVGRVTNAIEITGINNVVFSGGVSMNVKAMMEVSKIPSLKSLSVPPSGADESLCIGAAYHESSLYMEHKDIKFIKSAYLGKKYDKQEIKNFLEKTTIVDKERYEIIENVTSKNVAEKLCNGKIIALFTSNMEFGARALGSRSIIADPRYTETVKRINEKIKNRDFWMPFAPVVLDERFDEYFYNDKNIISPFMTIGFETKQLGKEHIKAALHPADKTGRPQRITRESNQVYYDIIKSFEEITGVGALLNTSFNLHGLPIVMTPKDAMHVMDNSDLDAVLFDDIMVLRKGVDNDE